VAVFSDFEGMVNGTSSMRKELGLEMKNRSGL
jgi:hypothetical protein